MSTYTNLAEFLQKIADAIRTKRGKTETINAQLFEQEILLIGPIYESKDIFNNGEHDITDYKKINVAVPGTEEYEQFLNGTLQNVVIPLNSTALRSGLMNYYGSTSIPTKLYVHDKVTSLGSITCNARLEIYYASKYSNWEKISWTELARAGSPGWHLYYINENTGEYELAKEVVVTKEPGNYYMQKNSGVEKVIFGEGINNGFGFEACYNLKEVVFSSTVTTLKAKAFKDTSIEYITIPSTLTNISGSQCLYNLSGNKMTVVMESSTPPICDMYTFNSSALNKIFVPLGSRSTYISASNWSYFANYIVEPNTITFNIPSDIVNNENYTYSIDNGTTWLNFETTNFVANNVTTIKFKNLDVNTVLSIGTTEGASDIGTIANAELIYATSGNQTIYISIQ